MNSKISQKKIKPLNEVGENIVLLVLNCYITGLACSNNVKSNTGLDLGVSNSVYSLEDNA